MAALLCIALCGMLPVEQPYVTDRVEVLEFNTFGNGGRQVIGWEEEHVVFWRFQSPQVSFSNPLLFMDGNILRCVEADRAIETETLGWDPEVADRKLLSPKERRELSCPKIRRR